MASISIALLLEFVIFHVAGVVQASFAASAFLFYGIPLDCTEHSFQYRVIFGHPGLVLSPAGTAAVGPPNLTPLAAVGPER